MKRIFFGGLLIVLGILFLMGNIYYLPYDIGEIVSTYWPALLILWGLNEIADNFRQDRNRYGMSNFFFPTILIALGSVLLGNNLDLFPLGDINLWHVFWPLVIIFIGLSFILPSRWKRPRVYVINRDGNKKKLNSRGSFDGDSQSVLLGSLHLGKEPWALEDSSYHIGVGEAKIDLSKALIKEGETKLQVSGCTGEIVLIIPGDVAVDVNASLDLGSITIFDREHSGTPRQVTYRSVDYDTAYKKLFIDVSLNIGEIIIKQVH
ncbi:cell wall-active antibiotics response protein LiaF [Alkaliphilus hydrothermalis]|uniref:Lia operon protein LiaF n=1 Tax=Alkaliphilus hydrothermalis TaxID=1482730 RepID=A0ABS2NTS8_9FIRM|nr:cell wall-active antibiotics response protein LiaF [Alkaliphilus hydrothermalis]MBM7616358.1 lia operon protein LiaF [Alkaliphilus hydrothermalis]